MSAELRRAVRTVVVVLRSGSGCFEQSGALIKLALVVQLKLVQGHKSETGPLAVRARRAHQSTAALTDLHRQWRRTPSHYCMTPPYAPLQPDSAGVERRQAPAPACVGSSASPPSDCLRDIKKIEDDRDRLRTNCILCGVWGEECKLKATELTATQITDGEREQSESRTNTEYRGARHREVCGAQIQ